MRRTVAIGGFMATGKSTVGALLAERLSRPFVDLDREIAARYGDIAAQFRREGEAVFRARETEMLALCVAGAPCVLATGGGAWVSEENHRWLSSSWRVVLTAPLDVLRARLGNSEDRPLWDASVASRWEERQAAYGRADAVFDTSRWSPRQVADRIAARVVRWEAV